MDEGSEGVGAERRRGETTAALSASFQSGGSDIPGWKVGAVWRWVTGEGLHLAD